MDPRNLGVGVLVSAMLVSGCGGAATWSSKTKLGLRWSKRGSLDSPKGCAVGNPFVDHRTKPRVLMEGRQRNDDLCIDIQRGPSP